MYGLIAKITTVAGARDEMIGVLRNGASNMPGCTSYVIAKDAADENVVWVTEVWDSRASHDASLDLPAVRDAVQRGRPLVARFEKIGTTEPVVDAGEAPAG